MISGEHSGYPAWFLIHLLTLKFTPFLVVLLMGTKSDNWQGRSEKKYWRGYPKIVVLD